MHPVRKIKFSFHFSHRSGSALWNLFATLMKLPVSGTHSILGSLLGFTLVAKHMAGIQWESIGAVVASWFISPLAAGFISFLGYYLLYKFVLRVNPSRRTGLLLKLFPLFFAIAVFVNVFSILFKGPDALTPFHYGSPYNPLFAFALSLFLAIITWVTVFFVLVPKQEKQIRAQIESPDSPDVASASELIYSDPPEVASVFKSLQILTSCFGSFAHGANDVSNAIGPLIAVYLIHSEGSVLQNGQVPIWLLLFGGCGISLGLWVMGRRVIETIGKDLTSVTPSSGFMIELCSSFTVLTASKLGFPISTTHCKVGSVVATGWIRKYLTSNDDHIPGKKNALPQCDESEEKSGVNWKLFAEISAAWVLTLPISAAMSAFVFWILQLIFSSYSGSDTCMSSLHG